MEDGGSISQWWWNNPKAHKMFGIGYHGNRPQPVKIPNEAINNLGGEERNAIEVN